MPFSSSRSLPRSVDAEREVLDGVEPILNPRERDERPHEPLPEQPAAHRRHRPIDLVEQRSGAAALGAFDDVEVPQRDRIDEQRVGGDAKRDVADVRELAALRVAQVRDDRAGGRRRPPARASRP